MPALTVALGGTGPLTGDDSIVGIPNALSPGAYKGLKKKKSEWVQEANE